MIHDIRMAARMAIKHPWLSAVVVLSIAIGIGANLTAWGIADAIFWRRLPVPDADRLIALYNRPEGGKGTFSGVSYPEYEYFRDNNDVLDGITSYLRVPLALQISEYPEPIIGELVASNFFSVTRVPIVLGRGLEAGDDRRSDRPLEMVLSHTLWQQRFAGDPNVVGKTVRLNQKSFTIVGVADPEFRGVLLDWQSPPQLWIPMLTQDPVFFANGRIFDAWNFHSIMTVGRMKTGVPLERATSVLRALDQRMTADHAARAAAFNGKYDFRLDVLPVQQARFFPAYRGEILSYVQMVGIVMAFLLGIAFLNLANLTIARSEARRKEYSIRLALGCGRLRLIRQSIAETVLLTLAGGVLSLGVASLLWAALASIDNAGAAPRFGRPFRVALPTEFRIDTNVFLSALVLSGVVGVLLGLWPALRVRRAQTSMRWRAAIIGVQVAASVILLICASLFVRTVRSIESVDNFVDRARISVVPADLAVERSIAFLDKVRLIPGIGDAVLKSGIQSRDPIASTAVSPGYFSMMGIPLLQGRDFTNLDDKGRATVAIVSEALARQLGLANPVGEHLRLNGVDTPFEIIGVAHDTSPSPRSPVSGLAYVSIRQFPRGATLQIRPEKPIATLLPALREALRQVDPNVPLGSVRTLQDNVEATLSRERLSATLVTTLGVIALGLMLIGLYGIVSYSVEARRREIGIRMAIGADSGTLLRMILGESLSIVLVGVLLGIGGCFVATKGIASMLFGVETTDPLSFGIVVGAILALSTVASLIPSWRASHANPSTVLRPD